MDRWGGVFAMNPGEKTLSDEEYRTWLKNIVLYYVNKGACAPFSIVHYDFF